MQIPESWNIEPVTHDNQKRLAIRFTYKADWNNMVRTLVGAKWSSSMRCWHVADNEDYRKLLGLVKNDKAIEGIKSGNKLDEKKQEEVKQFVLWMRNKRYSESTILAYSNVIKVLLTWIEKPSNMITNQDILEFNEKFILEKKLSATYQSQFINALKLFHQTIYQSKLVVENLVRPKQGRKLPNVLSEEEIENILNACENLKHKSMLSLIYSAGLRRGELLELKHTDINSKRMVIQIRNAKGKKDRIVPLSKSVLVMLREYFIHFKPKEYLFEGQYGGKYSERALEEALKVAVKKAGIIRHVNLHMLRHSYATHLMESGTHLRHIQELLGHKSPKTTQIYTHVSREEIGKIISPFDRLNIK